MLRRLCARLHRLSARLRSSGGNVFFKELETKLAETVDRFLVPSGASAHLVNAVKTLDGKVSSEDKENVVSPQQIERLRKKARTEKKDQFKVFEPEGLMVDERINKNKVERGVGEKGHKQFVVVKQKDCAVIEYPGEVFLGHLVPKGGKASQLAESVMSFAEERGLNLEDLVVVFADGCNKMGGFKHGFTAEFERLLGRPVLHVHCLCHSLEKTFYPYLREVCWSNKWTGVLVWRRSQEIGRQRLGPACG